VVFGVLGMLLGLVLFRFLKEPVRGAMDAGPTTGTVSMGQFFGILRRTPTALLLMGAFLCSNFVAVVLLTWMPKFVHDRFGMSLAASGLTATLYVQLASMAGSPLGGWLADSWRKRSAKGRAGVQMIGVLCGAPCVAWCGMTQSVGGLVLALTIWGLFKGLYDANIWASLFDVIRPEARGTAVGVMNMMGWLAGGGSAPLLIGYVADGAGLGPAIALASVVYVAAAGFLLVAMLFFVDRDVAKVAG
jgi:sugar phosphate permease